MRTALLAILLVVTTVVAQADPSQYLCIAEQSAGLRYDKQTKAWAPQVFVTHKKYIFRQLNDDDRKSWRALLKDRPGVDWAFFEFGETIPISLCGSCPNDLKLQDVIEQALVAGVALAHAVAFSCGAASRAA